MYGVPVLYCDCVEDIWNELRGRGPAAAYRLSSLFNKLHLLKLHNLCVNNDDCDESSWAMCLKPD